MTKLLFWTAQVTRVGVWLVWLAVAPGVACTDNDYELERRGSSTPPTAVKEPADGGAGASSEAIPFCDALTVVRAKCQRCHGDPLQNGAPVAFLTQADFQEPYYTSELKWWEVAVDVVGRDVMPYLVPNNPPTSLMPPVEPLTAAEKDALMGWLKQGALPEGGTDCP
jgi:hypothetical protein